MTRLFPAAWIIGWGIGTLELLISPEAVVDNGVRGGAPAGEGLERLALWVLGSGCLVTYLWPLKRVWLDGETLLVSKYFRREAIPLADDVNVRQRAFPWFGAVTLECAGTTPWGRRITFLPRGRRPRWFGQEGELVRELRALVEARGAGASH